MHYNAYSFIETRLPVLVELLHIGNVGQVILKYTERINLVCNRLLKRNTDATRMLVNML